MSVTKLESLVRKNSEAELSFMQIFFPPVLFNIKTPGRPSQRFHTVDE